jgi:hypothetical protein
MSESREELPEELARAGVGKTDEFDATAAAMSFLGKDLKQLLPSTPPPPPENSSSGSSPPWPNSNAN